MGAGAFGSVWRARDPQLGRVVAVKIPHAELVDSPKDLERIYREARTVAQLRHPGIVSVHEVLVHDGLPILVSDFVVGTTLRDLLAARRLSHREAAALVAKVAEALAYAHALGAIHRDIKPANIMVDRRVGRHRLGGTAACRSPQRRPGPLGEPRIVDFGLAFRDQDGIHSTQRGQLVGTPAYMSPEQAGGNPGALDGRADVYSLGVVLYEALAGTLPFSGTRSEVLTKLATRRAAAPQADRPDDLPRPGDDLPQGDGQGPAPAATPPRGSWPTTSSDISTGSRSGRGRCGSGSGRGGTRAVARPRPRRWRWSP